MQVLHASFAVRFLHYNLAQPSVLSGCFLFAILHRDLVEGAVLHHACSCCQQVVFWLLLDDSLAEPASLKQEIVMKLGRTCCAAAAQLAQTLNEQLCHRKPELWCRVCQHGDTES